MKMTEEIVQKLQKEYDELLKKQQLEQKKIADEISVTEKELSDCELFHRNSVNKISTETEIALQEEDRQYTNDLQRYRQEFDAECERIRKHYTNQLEASRQKYAEEQIDITATERHYIEKLDCLKGNLISLKESIIHFEALLIKADFDSDTTHVDTNKRYLAESKDEYFSTIYEIQKITETLQGLRHSIMCQSGVSQQETESQLLEQQKKDLAEANKNYIEKKEKRGKKHDEIKIKISNRESETVQVSARSSEKRISDLKRRISELQGQFNNIQKAHKAALADFIQKAKNSLDLYLQKADYQIEENKDVMCVNALPEQICIGNVVSGLGDFKILDILYPSRKVGYNSPILLNMRQQGNIIFNAKVNDENSNKLYRIVCGLVLKYMQCFPVGTLNVHIIDRSNDNLYFTKMANILSRQGIVRKHNSLESALDIAQNNVELVSQYFLNGINDVYDFYKTDRSEIAKVNLIVIKSGFFEISHNTAILQKIVNLMYRGGMRGGARFIIVNDRVKSNIDDEKIQYLIQELSKNALTLDFSNESVKLHEKDIAITEIEQEAAELFIENQCNKYIVALERKKQPLSYEEIDFGKARMDNKYSSALTIPVGKCGSDTFELVFNCGADDGTSTNAHYMALGIMNSGKSSLFHSIIINGAMKYSPEDLRFWLLDFKDSGASSFYKAAPIPHVEMISLTDDIENALDDAFALFRFLDEKMHERITYIRDIGLKHNNGKPFTELHEFNKFVDENPNAGQRLHRIIVLVDEAQNMFSAASANMDESDSFDIMKKLSELILDITILGRCVGIHLVLIAQNLLNNASRLGEKFVSNIKGKIAFGLNIDALRSSNFGQTFISTASEGGIERFDKGLCYVTCDNGIPKKVQMAYCNVKNASELNSYLKRIREAYKEGYFPTMFIGNRNPLGVLDGINGTRRTYEDEINHPVVIWNDKSQSCKFEITIGEDVYSMEPAVVTMGSPNGNICIVGDDVRMASSICKTLLSSLVCFENKKIYVCNGLSNEGYVFQNAIEDYTADKDIILYTMKDIDKLVKTLYDELLKRKETRETGYNGKFEPLFAVISGIDTISKIQKNCSLTTPRNSEMLSQGNQTYADFDAALDNMDRAMSAPFNEQSTEMANGNEQNVSIVTAIKILCKEGCSYSIFFNLSIRDAVNYSNFIKDSSNLILFNSINDMSFSLSNISSFELKRKLVKLKNQNGEETQALLLKNGSVYKIRPIIY